MFPATHCVSGKIDCQSDILDARRFFLGVVHQGFEQLGQVPDIAKREEQIDKSDAENLFLCHAAAQGFVGLLPVANFHREFRGKTPQENFRKIMQQSGNGDFVDIHVVSFERPVVSVSRGALQAPDCLQCPEQGLRFVLEHGFQRDWRADAGKKRFDALHHDRIADIRDIGMQALIAQLLDVREDPNGQ